MASTCHNTRAGFPHFYINLYWTYLESPWMALSSYSFDMFLWWEWWWSFHRRIFVPLWNSVVQQGSTTSRSVVAANVIGMCPFYSPLVGWWCMWWVYSFNSTANWDKFHLPITHGMGNWDNCHTRSSHWVHGSNIITRFRPFFLSLIGTEWLEDIPLGRVLNNRIMAFSLWDS